MIPWLEWLGDVLYPETTWNWMHVLACHLKMRRLEWMKKHPKNYLFAIICYHLYVWKHQFSFHCNMDLCLSLIFNQTREFFWWNFSLQVLFGMGTTLATVPFFQLKQVFLCGSYCPTAKNVKKKWCHLGGDWRSLSLPIQPVSLVEQVRISLISIGNSHLDWKKTRPMKWKQGIFSGNN